MKRGRALKYAGAAVLGLLALELAATAAALTLGVEMLK